MVCTIQNSSGQSKLFRPRVNEVAPLLSARPKNSGSTPVVPCIQVNFCTSSFLRKEITYKQFTEEFLPILAPKYKLDKKLESDEAALAHMKEKLSKDVDLKKGTTVRKPQPKHAVKRDQTRGLFQCRKLKHLHVSVSV